MWCSVWKTTPVTIILQSNYYSPSIYIGPKVSIFMKWNWPEKFFWSSIFTCFTSMFSSKNYCHWFFFFHILHAYPLCIKTLPKKCYKSQWNGDKQTPSQNKWEWETYCSDFLITEELLWDGKKVKVLTEKFTNYLYAECLQ